MLAFSIMKAVSLLLLVLGLVACQAIQSAPADTNVSTAIRQNTVQYDITQQITLANEGQQKPEKHNIWVALISDQPPFQEVLSRDIQPANYVMVTDEYGNEYAEFDLRDLQPGDEAKIAISYKIATHGLTYDFGDCAGDLPDDYIQPELHIESKNPQIARLSRDLSASYRTPCEQVRAFYDYVGHNLTYTYNGANWGAQAALGKMGADCTEYSSLLIALSRASGIPARYVEGLLVLDADNANVARQEHAWTEIYFPEIGWVPVDPTLGRLPLTRDQHFAHYTPNHIIVTNGRSPSTLRGASYWSHLYWPGDSTLIRIEDAGWTITPES